MEIVQGNLWDEIGKAHLILVTTNACVNQYGQLVMGRGAAKEAHERFRTTGTTWGVARDFGEQLITRGMVESEYGIIYSSQIIPGTLDTILIGAFQVKYRWHEEASLKLIDYSTNILGSVARKHPEKRIALNYPGIGNGRLMMETVEPIISTLPDNVFIYKR